jgi:hypothetical protein
MLRRCDPFLLHSSPALRIAAHRDKVVCQFRNRKTLAQPAGYEIVGAASIRRTTMQRSLPALALCLVTMASVPADTLTLRPSNGTLSTGLIFLPIATWNGVLIQGGDIATDGLREYLVHGDLLVGPTDTVATLLSLEEAREPGVRFVVGNDAFLGGVFNFSASDRSHRAGGGLGGAGGSAVFNLNEGQPGSGGIFGFGGLFSFGGAGGVPPDGDGRDGNTLAPVTPASNGFPGHNGGSGSFGFGVGDGQAGGDGLNSPASGGSQATGGVGGPGGFGGFLAGASGTAGDSGAAGDGGSGGVGGADGGQGFIGSGGLDGIAGGAGVAGEGGKASGGFALRGGGGNGGDGRSGGAGGRGGNGGTGGPGGDGGAGGGVLDFRVNGTLTLSNGTVHARGGDGTLGTLGSAGAVGSNGEIGGLFGSSGQSGSNGMDVVGAGGPGGFASLFFGSDPGEDGQAIGGGGGGGSGGDSGNGARGGNGGPGAVAPAARSACLRRSSTRTLRPRSIPAAEAPS